MKLLDTLVSLFRT